MENPIMDENWGYPIYGTSSCLFFSSNVTILRSFICFFHFVMVLSTNWSQQPNAISQAAAGLLVLFWSENGLLRKAMGFKATNEGFQWLLRCYLVGGLEHFLFFHILGIITPTDFHILQRGWNQQPVIYPRSYPFFGPGESFPSVDQGIQHWPCTGIMTGNLVGGFKHGLYFSTIYGITLPIDELRFFKVVKTTNQKYVHKIMTGSFFVWVKIGYRIKIGLWNHRWFGSLLLKSEPHFPSLNPLVLMTV